VIVLEAAIWVKIVCDEMLIGNLKRRKYGESNQFYTNLDLRDRLG